MPIYALWLPFIIPKDSEPKLKAHRELTRQMTRKRIELQDSMKREDFFAQILKKQKDVSEDELISQAETLVVAGSDTTSTLLAALTYYLCKNPAAMARLADEVRSSFASAEDITGDATSALRYLNATIKEGLRVFSPAAFGLQRVCPGAEIDGRYVPEGTVVSAAQWTTNFDPRYYPAPDAFRPERWLDGGGLSADARDAHQPFSLGPRACLGINLANLEARLILARMVYAYDWRIDDRSAGVDWQRDSVHNTTWKMPTLWVRFTKPAACRPTPVAATA